MQIKAYFETKPIWHRNELLLQKFYIYAYHIKYFTDRRELNRPNKGKDDQKGMVYDFDIASIILDHKRYETLYSSIDKPDPRLLELIIIIRTWIIAKSI